MIDNFKPHFPDAIEIGVDLIRLKYSPKNFHRACYVVKEIIGIPPFKDRVDICEWEKVLVHHHDGVVCIHFK